MENNSLKNIWLEAWDDRFFRFQFVISLAMLFSFWYIFSRFFKYIEERPGIYLNDFVLQSIPVMDVSWFTFLLIYSTLIITVIHLLPNPWLLMKGIQAYCLLLVMRVISIYLVPLEPAPTIIPLNDPFIEYMFFEGEMISKDLFFSGHTSTTFMLFLIVRGRYLKAFMLAATILMGVLLLVQHVHYTVDVLAAPFFAWLSFKLVMSTHSWWDKKMGVSGMAVL